MGGGTGRGDCRSAWAYFIIFFFFQAEDGIRDISVTGVQTCALPIYPDAGAFSIGAGIWWTLSGIIASFCGGVVAGRLCGAAKATTARWHGFVAWCATTLVIFYLLASALGGIVGGTFSALGGTLGGVGRTVASAATGIAQNTDAGGLEARVRGLVNPSDTQSVQDSVVAYIRASVSGDQRAASEARDRAVDGLARVANVSPEEARTRLN